MGDPIGVDLDERWPNQPINQHLHRCGAINVGQFMAVVVIADGQAGLGKAGSELVVLIDEALPKLAGKGFLGEETAYRGVLAIPEAMLFNHRIEALAHIVQADVRDAAGQTIVLKSLGDIFWVDRADTGNLYRLVADGANLL